MKINKSTVKRILSVAVALICVFSSIFVFPQVAAKTVEELNQEIADIEKDIKKGSYNPLKNTENPKDLAERQLYFSINEATNAFELLKVYKFKNILGNIITLYNFYQFRPDNFMNLCFIIGIYYLFSYIKNKQLFLNVIFTPP